MANVIDTLIVELALDPTKFTAAQQQAVSAARQMTQQLLAHAKEVEAAGARITHFFESAKRELLAVTGLLLGGRSILEFVKMDAEMARTARTIGISTEQLAKWGAMARQTGGDVSSVAGSLGGLSERIAEAQITGNWGSMLQVFGRLGINLRDTKEGLVDIDNLFDQLNQRLSQMDPVSAKAMLALLGITDPSTIHLLTMRREEFLSQARAAQEMAKGLDDAADKAEGFYKSLQAARAEGDLWIARMIGEWSPQLKAIVDKVREWFHLTMPTTSEHEANQRVEQSRTTMEHWLGPSPWREPPPSPPMDIVETAKGRGVTSYVSPSDARWATHRWAVGDTGIEDYNNPNLRPDQRAGVPFGHSGRGHFASYLAAGPTERSGSGTTNNSSSTTNIGTVNVTISGADSPEETGKSVYRWFQRFSQGAATYNGPH